MRPFRALLEIMVLGRCPRLPLRLPRWGEQLPAVEAAGWGEPVPAVEAAPLGRTAPVA